MDPQTQQDDGIPPGFDIPPDLVIIPPVKKDEPERARHETEEEDHLHPGEIEVPIGERVQGIRGCHPTDTECLQGAPSYPKNAFLLDRITLEQLDPAALEAQLDTWRTESDGSTLYLRSIALLESVLATRRPDRTHLLPNYPNPFNPETWIPYHLATPSQVEITIYDTRGTVVRHLDLGHQQAGYYTSRSRAVYWDGCNDIGEKVSSGIYFYQLQTDRTSLLRKMLILK